MEVFEHHLDDRLSTLKQRVLKADYTPSPINFCDVPKRGGTIRTGNYLTIEDRVVYAACVGACQPKIYDAVKWAQDEVDFSYRLSGDHALKRWFKNIYGGWKSFRKTSLSKLEKFDFVVFTDISNFYDAIHIRTLTSDLSHLSVSQEIVSILSDCLQSWDVFEGRGIPQGISASHLLAKLYLNNIDKNLKRMGYSHCRYSDDYRIFCESPSQAKSALIDITKLMRNRGLKMQTAKTEIMSAEDARKEIENVQPVIQRIRDRFVEEVNTKIPTGEPYLGLVEADKAVRERALDDPSLEVVKEAYERYFISGNREFDKSLFHFLIKRLGDQGDETAVNHCMTLLTTHPQETAYILDYFQKIGHINKLESDFVDFINSEKAVYDYQIYQIISRLTASVQNPSPQLMGFVYQVSFDSSRPDYLRGACIRCLGKHGSSADLERLRSDYEGLSLQNQYVAICALRNVEKSIRNAFYNAISRSSEIHDLYVSYVKAT